MRRAYSAQRVQEGSISRIVGAADRWKALLESAVTAAVGSLFHIHDGSGKQKEMYTLFPNFVDTTMNVNQSFQIPSNNRPTLDMEILV